MSSIAEPHVAALIRNTPLTLEPFPHLRVENVFPEDFYRKLLRHFPPPESLPSLERERGTRGYPDRFALGLQAKRLREQPEPLRVFWSELAGWMLGEPFLRAVMGKFAPFITERFPGTPSLALRPEALLVSDRTGYSLGPHTDVEVKVISMLFYLPADDSLAEHGTSLYVPLEQGFTCERGIHYEFDGFERVATVPFLPNSMLAFPKSARSFHGVEPILETGVLRQMLLYDVRLERLPPAGSPPGARADGT